MSLGKNPLAERFEALVAPLEKKVYFTCLHLMGNREDAEDCAQEALLKAYKNFHQFSQRSSFSTWLYTLVTRVCLDALRKRKPILSLNALADEGYEPDSQEADSYLLLERNERIRALKLAINQLPLEHRAALVLIDLQGLSYQETAQVLNIPDGTLKSRVNRGRKALYKILLTDRELFVGELRLNDRKEAGS